MSVIAQLQRVESYLREQEKLQKKRKQAEQFKAQEKYFFRKKINSPEISPSNERQPAHIRLRSFTLNSIERLAKRVLICSDVAPHRNGVGAYYADLIDDIKDHVAAVEMFCPAEHPTWRDGFSVPLPGDVTQRVPLPNLIRLAQRIQAFRPDVVVTATQGAYGIVGACIGHHMGARVLAGYHTCFTRLVGLYWDRFRTGTADIAFSASNRYVFQYADAVLANSEDMISLAQQYGAQQTQLIGTPVPTRYLKTPIRRLPKKVKKILFVGRLAVEKNIDAVVASAFALPHLSFSVVGHGPERARLKKISAKLPNLSLVGWVDRAQMDRVMDAHDVLVLPSKVESFGTVALEAMARQRIVVASEACGICGWPCLRAGLRVLNSSESLTDVLGQLAQLDEFEVFARGVRARAAVRQHVQWNRQLWLKALREDSPRARQQLGRLGVLKTATLLTGLR